MIRHMLLVLLSFGCRHSQNDSRLGAESGPMIKISDHYYRVVDKYLLRAPCEQMYSADSPCLEDAKKVFYHGFQVVFSRQTVDQLNLDTRLQIFALLEGRQRIELDSRSATAVRRSFEKLLMMPPDGTIHIAAGDSKTYAISLNGQAFSWGFDPDAQNTSRPEGSGFGVFADLIPGQFRALCLLKVDGVTECSDGDRHSVQPNLEQYRFIKVFKGNQHYCGIDAEYTAFCWGGKNQYGELGSGEVGNEKNQVYQVKSEVKFKTLALGFSHSCGIDMNGKAYCWGSNSSSGALGTGDKIDHYIPTPVATDQSFHSISAAQGWWSTCALNTEGAAYCWGSNADGILGTPPVSERSCDFRDRPTKQLNEFNFKQIAITGDINIAIDVNGHLYKWWCNSSCDAKCGPKAIFGEEFAFASIGTLGKHACGIEYNVAYCWGSNQWGQLGNGRTGSNENAHSPVPVKMPKHTFE